jgi:twitching motility protein PilT
VARIDAFLQLGREQGCSDIHFAVGLPPLVRLDGELTPIKYRSLTLEEAESILAEILDEHHRVEFERRGAVDLSYMSPEAGRFRINICRQARGISAVCRVIPQQVVALEQLGLPPVIASFARLNAGLVLVTGATGTGKSTTLAAIIDRINRTRNAVILTLEDPVEFLHASDKALVIQRELGTSLRSYSEGLRAALREDPDVILVGELRDAETIALALEAAETGHLVLGTLHTRGAAQTIDRILDAFPSESHNQVRNTLADNLRCVMSQELIRASDGRGRRAAMEILVNVPAVAQMIREGKTFQLQHAMETGKRFGMQLMDRELLKLVQAGDIDPDEAYLRAADKRPFLAFATSAGGAEAALATQAAPAPAEDQAAGSRRAAA